MQLISNFREGRIRTSDHKVMSLNPETEGMSENILDDIN